MTGALSPLDDLRHDAHFAFTPDLADGKFLIEDAIFHIIHTPRFAWTASWWGLNEVLIATSKRTWSTKNLFQPLPKGVVSIGSTGSDPLGNLATVSWDLDVAHGRVAYHSTEAALQDARRIRDIFEGAAEIRLSRSGLGVHVRYKLPRGPVVFPADGGPPQFPGWTPRPASDGPKIARAVAWKLNVRADPAALSRQGCWLWSLNTNANSFKLIEACL